MKLIKTQSRQKIGTYRETEIDKTKREANRLVSISGNIYTVIMATGETIFLKGKREWNKFTKNNEYVTDF